MFVSKYHIWIAGLLFWDYLEILQTAQLICYKGSLSNSYYFSLEEPTSLLNSDCFNASLDTFIYTFGFTGKVAGPATITVISTYIRLGDRNVILLDWQKEASNTSLGIAISYGIVAVLQTKIVGSKLGKALLILKENGLNLSSVKLVGLSMGAHLMGIAGRWARDNGCTLPWILGLDPPGILYDGPLYVLKGLDSTCATTVVVLHTNPGSYGSSQARGTVDIWPNYNSQGLQPGCPTGNFALLSDKGLCSHNRCWMYYVEAILKISIIIASGASSYHTWLTQDKSSNPILISLGDNIDNRTSGNFYLTTNGEFPFGKGIDGAYSQSET